MNLSKLKRILKTNDETNTLLQTPRIPPTLAQAEAVRQTTIKSDHLPRPSTATADQTVPTRTRPPIQTSTAG